MVDQWEAQEHSAPWPNGMTPCCPVCGQPTTGKTEAFEMNTRTCAARDYRATVQPCDHKATQAEIDEMRAAVVPASGAITRAIGKATRPGVYYPELLRPRRHSIDRLLG